jgi:hypothetical protein
MVSKSQLFLIYSISICIFGSTYKFSCWRGVNKSNFSFVRMWDNVIYVNPCSITLTRSKANSFSDNPWKQWMVLVATSWIGNWILVMINDWDLPVLISLMIGSIGVHFYSMLL